MIVTSRFVLLNFPKTGSSFVRQVVKRIYARRRWRWGADRFLTELMLPRREGQLPGVDQHGTYRQIPAAYRDRDIVSIIRNPYERLLSVYRFRWWQQHPTVPVERVRQLLPNYPDLTLDEFVEFTHLEAAAHLGRANPDDLGRQTVEFVNFFFADPQRVLSNLSSDYVESGAFKAELAAVKFLRQENLREDLAAFLAGHGFRPDEVKHCWRTPAANVTSPKAPKPAWTVSGLAVTTYRERYLLGMLRQLGFDYAEPIIEESCRDSEDPVRNGAARSSGAPADDRGG